METSSSSMNPQETHNIDFRSFAPLTRMQHLCPNRDWISPLATPTGRGGEPLLEPGDERCTLDENPLSGPAGHGRIRQAAIT